MVMLNVRRKRGKPAARAGQPVRRQPAQHKLQQADLRHIEEGVGKRAEQIGGGKRFRIIFQRPYGGQIQPGRQIRYIAEGLVEHYIDRQQIQDDQTQRHHVIPRLVGFGRGHQYSTSRLRRYLLIGTATMKISAISAMPTAAE